MTREEFVQRLVLDKICDDYENVDQTILVDVVKDGVECGMNIDRTEVVDALAVLIAEGLAKAYVLPSREPYSRRKSMACRRSTSWRRMFISISWRRRRV
jgi:hypothetical protein